MAQQFDQERFFERIKKIYALWNENCHQQLSKVDAIAISRSSGKKAKRDKTFAIHTWLFGYPLADSLLVFCKSEILFLSSKTDVELLTSIEKAFGKNSGIPSLQLLTRDKGKTVGRFLKEKASGKFVDLWMNTLNTSGFKTIDVGVSFALMMAAKDAAEFAFVKAACGSTCTVFETYLRQRLGKIVDTNKRITYNKIRNGLERAYKTEVYGTDSEDFQLCYAPVIQFGDTTNQSGDSNLHFDIITCSFGLRYKHYCSSIIRTLLVDPSPELQEMYSLLIEAEAKVLATMKPGATLSEVYDAAKKFIRDSKPNTALENKMSKNIGFGTGIKYCERPLLIGPENAVAIERGMTFCIKIGFSDINIPSAKDEDGRKVALMIGYTVIVEDEGAISLTAAAEKMLKSVSTLFKNQLDDKPSTSRKFSTVDKLPAKGIMKHDELIIEPNKTNPRLPQLRMRPKISREQLSGSVEAQSRGLRFTSSRGYKVDILYNNIKHAFFQPCDRKMILLHFRLKNPILIGKQNEDDIQFFIDESTAARSGEAERKLRPELKSAFKSFYKKVTEISNPKVKFHTPKRSLEFKGVLKNELVWLQLTSDCLVHLNHWPPFVVTLREVEWIHFERVSFVQKTIDMAIILKDVLETPTMVKSIQFDKLKSLKNWPNLRQIRCTESSKNQDWPNIMKYRLDDREGFYSAGGWEILISDSDDDDDQDYNPAEDGGSEDNSDDCYVSEPTPESGSIRSLESGESRGKNWSELEEEARRADDDVEEDSRRNRRKVAQSAPKKAVPTKRKKFKKIFYCTYIYNYCNA